MALFRFPGPICQISRWQEVDDGTLVRAPSPPPGSVDASESASEETEPAPATGDCGYLNPRESGTVRAPAAAFDRLRGATGAASITAEQPVADHRWRDGTSSAAVEQAVVIDGHRIRTIRPTEADAAGKNLPSTQQIAEALRAIPSRQRVRTNTVIASHRPHPGSTARRTIAGDAGSGVTTLFPVNTSQTQNDFDNRIMHESGHNYQETLWDSGDAVAEWGAVAERDGRRPSGYAAEGVGEDFCEFLILYNTSRDTSCEASARRLYPHRWAKMVEYQSR